jgi:O2-independent ubiquinone biosynthesis accessory factor UbiT
MPLSDRQLAMTSLRNRDGAHATAEQFLTWLMQHMPLLSQLLPPLLVEQLAERLLNQVLAPALKQGELAQLEGRWLAIDCSDWPYPLRISKCGGHFQVCTRRGSVDASIRGSLSAFLALLRQDADPDTLFFQRQLTTQGDTELALAIKNFLDTLEPEQLPKLLRYLLRSRAAH